MVRFRAISIAALLALACALTASSSLAAAPSATTSIRTTLHTYVSAAFSHNGRLACAQLTSNSRAGLVLAATQKFGASRANAMQCPGAYEAFIHPKGTLMHDQAQVARASVKVHGQVATASLLGETVKMRHVGSRWLIALFGT